MALCRPARASLALRRAERRTLGRGLVALGQGPVAPALGTADGLIAGLTFTRGTDRSDRTPTRRVPGPPFVGVR
jgi:hypothetical protein